MNKVEYRAAFELEKNCSDRRQTLVSYWVSFVSGVRRGWSNGYVIAGIGSSVRVRVRRVRKLYFKSDKVKQYNISSHLKWVLVADKSMHIINVQ